MSQRTVVQHEHQRSTAVIDASNAEIPFVQTIKPYKKDRSQEQNRLSHAWYAQVAAELREDTPAGVKGFCKLHFGVPILRGESEEFCDIYDRLIKPQTYEWKIEI